MLNENDSNSCANAFVSRFACSGAALISKFWRGAYLQVPFSQTSPAGFVVPFEKARP
jgi:hypothetical protein